MRTGVNRIAAERYRQISREGYTAETDDNQAWGSFALAGACYALTEPMRDRTDFYGRSLLAMLWPWADRQWKPTPENRIKELAKAGALIAAEIDWLLRRDGDGEDVIDAEGEWLRDG